MIDRSPGHHPRSTRHVLWRVLLALLVIPALVFAARTGMAAVHHGSGNRVEAGALAQSQQAAASTSTTPRATAHATAHGTGTTAPTPTAPVTRSITSAALAEPTAALTAALSGIPGRYSVAVTDTATGRTAAITHVQTSYAEASVVKVAILAVLLLQAQDDGRALTATERANAAAMIEHSDNTAATALWNEVGGDDGMATGLHRLGLDATVPGADNAWGTTTTTATDQIHLLHQLTTDNSPLNSVSRAYELGLMRQVETDQAWGVSAPADTGSAPALKDGWFAHSDTATWVANSVGVITYHGHSVLVAVLTDGNSTLDVGHALAVNLAERAVPAVVGT